MIRNYKHKGLKRLHLTGDSRQVKQHLADRLSVMLDLLEVAQKPLDMDFPGYELHELKGKRKGEWNIKVNKNWRVVFRVKDEHVVDVDIEDYH